MKFENASGFAAHLYRTELRKDEILCSLLVRVRYVLEDGRTLRLAEGDDGCRDVRREALDLGEYGTVENDSLYPRRGTDVIVLGDAIPPGGKESVATRVRLSAGPYLMALNVFGDRVWEKLFGAATLTASPPRPFSRMPVTYRNAYGGSATTEVGKVPSPNNPIGKGFYVTKEEALGQPLPNVELADQPIQSFEDRPDPGGFGPYSPAWGLRVRDLVEVESGKITPRPDRGLFDRAHPALSAKRLASGDRFELTGMTAGKPVDFTLPECPVEVEVFLGGATHVRSLHIEEVLVDLRPDRARPTVELAFRKMFKYLIVPYERRTATLRRRGA